MFLTLLDVDALGRLVYGTTREIVFNGRLMIGDWQILYAITSTEVEGCFTSLGIITDVGKGLIHRSTIFSNRSRGGGEAELVIVDTIEGFLGCVVMVSVVGRHDTMAMGAGIYGIVLPSRCLIGDLGDK